MVNAPLHSTCECLTGIVVFRFINTAITPPAVSIPKDRGVTSRSRISRTASELSPVRMAACTAAPYATASSGLIDLLSSLPWNMFWRRIWTLGIRVEPPTSTISSICQRNNTKLTLSTAERFIAQPCSYLFGHR